MSESYIIAARRTPIGKLLGALANVPAPQLAEHVVGADLSALVDRMKQFSFEPQDSHSLNF